MIDYKVLNIELTEDPSKVGYQDFIKKGDDMGVASLVNSITNDNIVPREAITASGLFGSIDPGEFFKMDSLQLQQLQCILSINSFNLNDPSSEKILFNILGPISVSSLQLLQNRPGSRSESLFGSGVSITVNDVAIALGRK